MRLGWSLWPPVRTPIAMIFWGAAHQYRGAWRGPVALFFAAGTATAQGLEMIPLLAGLSGGLISNQRRPLRFAESASTSQIPTISHFSKIQSCTIVIGANITNPDYISLFKKYKVAP